MTTHPVINLLRNQAALAKTPEGRVIIPEMVDRVLNCVGNPTPESTDYTSCLNCGFFLEDPYFLDGCPNCGCKDVEPLSVNSIFKNTV